MQEKWILLPSSSYDICIRQQHQRWFTVLGSQPSICTREQTLLFQCCLNQSGTNSYPRDSTTLPKSPPGTRLSIRPSLQWLQQQGGNIWHLTWRLLWIIHNPHREMVASHNITKTIYSARQVQQITVKYFNPKPNGGHRLVTAFEDVGRYSKPLPYAPLVSGNTYSDRLNQYIISNPNGQRINALLQHWYPLQRCACLHQMCNGDSRLRNCMKNACAES